MVPYRSGSDDRICTRAGAVMKIQTQASVALTPLVALIGPIATALLTALQ